MSDEQSYGLVGRCFVICGKDGYWNYQGHVRGSPEPGVYLCQYFSCFDGSPTEMFLCRVEDMVGKKWGEEGAFKFFHDDEHLRDWIDHRAPKRAA